VAGVQGQRLGLQDAFAHVGSPEAGVSKDMSW